MRSLGLTAFQQYADGDLSFENERGQVTRGLGYASMAGSFRLQGGLAALIDATIHQHLEAPRLSLDLRVTALQHPSTGITATCVNAQNHSQTIDCQAVVLALPPRVIAGEPETATQLDTQPQYTHPTYGLPHALSNLWQGQLMLGSTEVATQFGGYLEGALESSERLSQTLIPKYAR